MVVDCLSKIDIKRDKVFTLKKLECLKHTIRMNITAWDKGKGR